MSAIELKKKQEWDTKISKRMLNILEKETDHPQDAIMPLIISIQSIAASLSMPEEILRDLFLQTSAHYGEILKMVEEGTWEETRH